MGIFGAAHGLGEGGWGKKTWHSYTLPKENPKNI